MEATLNQIRTALLLIAVATVPPALAQEREFFSGAAFMYSVPEITIVYPAGPAEDREFNRVSAERRAAYLAGRHRTITHVVADVDITADERKAHLLVLGWNNLLLQEVEAVALTADGWSFQNIERGFSHDLLFGWISPFSQSHEFFFWSRIDPELDRYLILPFFGSDWIVYDRLTVEQFGRFHKEELEWPPRRNLDVQIDNRTVRPRPAPKRESEHYVLFDVSLGLSDGEIEKILQAREVAWSTAVAALGVAPQKPIKIKLYVYEDSAAKELITDVADGRHHLPKRAEFHTIKVIAMDPDLHEDMHLIARQTYGPGYLSLLVEGLAVWAEQQRGTNELPVYAAMLADRVDLPGIAGLLDEETMRVLVRNRIGFAVAGLFVAWLRAEVGPDAVPNVYGQYESDAALFAKTIGLSVDEIDTRFAAFVAEQAEAGKTETLFRDATAQARHYAGLGDYEQAIPALERALELRPADLFTRYSLAVARMKLDDLEAAETELRKILEIHRETPNDELALAAWYQLGELHSSRGEREMARNAYEQVFELPDYRGMHGRTRNALAEISGTGASADAP